jgi:hypothetical protein
MIQNHKPKCKTCEYNTHCGTPDVCDAGEIPLEYEDVKDEPAHIYCPEDEIPYD